MIGQAGAAVVDSTLLARGIPIVSALEGQAWDRMALLGSEAVTIQVKTTTRLQPCGSYAWAIACGYRNSPRGRRAYESMAFTLLACVVLPRYAVRFFAPGPTRVTMRPEEIPGVLRDPLASWRQALHDVGLGRLSGPEPDDAPF
ncbi:MAG: hypothetical protein AAF264_03380 [Pseudomonadota bacterium]